MADKKDSPSSKSGGKPDARSDAKPGSAPASSDKKPKPLLDLKAKEVRPGSSASDSKPAPTSALKGAPGWKAPADKGSTASSTSTSSVPSAGSSGTSAAADTAGSTRSSSGSSTSAPATSTAAKMATVDPPAGKKASTDTASASSGRPSATPATAASATSRPGDGNAAATKPAAATSAGSASASGASSGKPPGGPGGASKPAAAAPPPAARSGGGFAATLSHLAAGIVGGGIALFAAEPLSQQFGVALMPQPKVPASIEQRLAALESKPAAAADDGALRQDVAQLAERVTATQQRLAELDALGKQVASLASDVEKAQAATPSGGADASATAAETAALRDRLAKLESTMATLSSATTNDGQPSSVASAAQFSAKLADLESALKTQLGSVRQNLMNEVDTRLAKTADATAKAVAGTERLDRELADVKTDSARLDQRATVLKTASDKLAASTRAISEQAAQLKVELDGLKGELTQQLAKVARPDDVQQAIAPVSAKVAAIEKDLGSVLANESARRANAERIVLSLELSKLKRVLDRGQPYGTELADVKRIAGDKVDFGAIDAHQDKGVPSGAELTRRFNTVAYRIIDAQNAPKDASRINRLLAAAKSIVQVRRTDLPAEEKTAEAAVAQIEKQLKRGNLSGALTLAEKLPDEAKAPARDWIGQLAARAGVDRAIAKIEDQLKASLGGVAERKS